MNDDIETVTNDTGRFLAILADESHPVDRHCKCGRVLLSAFFIACEVCEPAQLPGILRKQAA